MKVLDKIHGTYVHDARVKRLCAHLCDMLPRNASVLDVGCGDGLLASKIMQQRPDVSIRGIDVMVRPGTHIPVESFDGLQMPAEDNAYDIVMFVDVLHHTADPLILLREASRVASKAVVIKDHLRNGLGAYPTLRFMDYVGNARYNVALPYNYWARGQWTHAFKKLGLSIELWRKHLRLYPFPVDLIFGRSLHFVARLKVGG